MTPQEKQQPGAAVKSLIRKLTTEKAVKAHRQQSSENSNASEDGITSIKLSLRGIKTIESLDLPSLRRLDLSKNNLNRLKGLQGCPQVTYLTAAGNELTGDGLDGVRPLKDLKVLNASGNRVRRIPPAVFAQFRQLQALVLNNNEIAEVPPTWFKKGLLSLNTLVLSHNKVKSLSDARLGRLTALTKLSVSHNALVELPDLSPCSGLEEIRAAHNLITQVPATLNKNAALRTLDLGHNRIGKWIGLERLGKSLASLKQLSLAGNPLCGTAASPEEQEVGGAGEGKEDEGHGEGGYVAKIRSLFPGLKVRDGKRILMKKSHTYYEAREDEDGGGNGGDAGKASQPRRRKITGHSSAGGGKGLDTAVNGDGRQNAIRGDREEGANKSKPSEELVWRGRVGSERQAGEEDGHAGTGSDGKSSKAERKLKKKAARAAAMEENADVDAEKAAFREAGKKAKKRRLREVEEERGQPLRLAGESTATATVAHANAGDSSSGKNQRRRSKKAVGASTSEAVARMGGIVAVEGASNQKPAKKLKKPKENREAPSGGGGGGGGGGGSFVGHEEDPYSSSEELPIPGRQAIKGGGGVLGGGNSGAAKGAQAALPVGGDGESGVVSVVINKKRRGAKGAAAPGYEDGAGGFSIEAMLVARSQKETIGSGSGVSAWDV